MVIRPKGKQGVKEIVMNSLFYLVLYKIIILKKITTDLFISLKYSIYKFYQE